MRFIPLLFIISLVSCQSQKQFMKKGMERGWIDTSTVKIIDTIHLMGSSKDTLFYGSVDTLYLKDKNFTTEYYRDSITNKIYLKTIVNNRDTTIIREVKTTTIKATEYSIWDHLKAVWFVWIALFALVVIALIYSISKK